MRDLERSGENLFRMDLPILLARNHKSHRRTGGNCLSCFQSPGMQIILLLIAESEEELKSLLMKVKEESIKLT